MRLAKPNARVGMQFGMITLGCAISLAVRALSDPVIHHSFRELPRLDVGLAVVLLMIAPTWRSWHGTAFSLLSGALILNHFVFFPGIAIIITVLGIGFIGDGWRDALNRCSQET